MRRMRREDAQQEIVQALGSGGLRRLLGREGAAQPRWFALWRALSAPLTTGDTSLEALLQQCRQALGDTAFARQVADVTRHWVTGRGLEVLPTPGHPAPECAEPGHHHTLLRDQLHEWRQAHESATAKSSAEWIPRACWRQLQLRVLVVLGEGDAAEPVPAVFRVCLLRVPGANLSWVPLPASTLHECTASWLGAMAQAREAVRWWIDPVIALDHALAWDLFMPDRLVTELDGNSAGAVKGLAALFLLRHAIGPAAAAKHPSLAGCLAVLTPAFLVRQGITAALGPDGRLSEVGGVADKLRIVQAWRDAPEPPDSRLHVGGRGEPGPLPEGPADVIVHPHRTMPSMVEALAELAEPMTLPQRALLARLLQPGEQLDAVSDELLQGVLESRWDKPTLRHYLLRCWAQREQLAGGQVHQHFVRLRLRPDQMTTEAWFTSGAVRDSLDEITDEAKALGSHALVLLGPPGAGKTTLLQCHVQRLARALLRQLAGEAPDPAFKAGGEVPVYLPLNAAWAAAASGEDWQRLEAELAREGAPAELSELMRGTGPWHEQRLRARVMLDGLNELTAADDEARALRASELVRQVRQRLVEPLALVLTIRDHHLLELPSLAVQRVDVLEWDDDAIQKYLKRRFPQRDPALQQRIDTLLASPQAMDLCRRPLHLAQSCDLLKEGFSVPPDNRAALYRAWIWMRLRRELGHGFVPGPRPDPTLWAGLLTTRDRTIAGNLETLLKVASTRLPGGELFKHLRQHALALWEAAPGTGSDAGGSAGAGSAAARTEGTARRLPRGELHSPGTDEALRERLIDTAVALGIARADAADWWFAHQSLGEYLASCEVLNGMPHERGAALVPRLMPPPLRGEDDAQELELLRFEEAEHWLKVDKAVWSAMAQPLPVDGTALIDEVSTYEPMQAGAEDPPRRRALRWLRRNAYLDAPHAQLRADGENFVADLARWGSNYGLDRLPGLAAGERWVQVAQGWQRLAHDELLFDSVRPAFWCRLGELLREQLGDARAAEELLARLQAEPGRLELPPAPEGRQVVGLALLGLERDDDLRGWLQWLVLNGHWAVLAEVLPPLVRRLEGAQPGVPAGHGRLREPVLQHLRRVLLLTSVDAGTASLPQLQASGLLGLLDAEPAVAMPEPLRAQWRALRAGAFQGEGVRLRHRLQAGLMLGWLGDNIRYEFVQRARPNGGLVRGLRPKPALWAEVGVPGRKTVFPIGSPRGVGWPDERPAWTAELEHFRLCRLPLTVGEWRCFMEGGAKARHESGTARLAGWNNPLQPVTGITWRGAVAYAAWAQALYEPERAANGRVLQLGLPSEVQWEAAVRGPRNAVDTSAAAQERSALEVNHNDTRWVKPSPVSVFSACPSPLGLFDALGNVWEWCSNGDTAEGFNEGWTPSKRTLAQAVAGDDAPLRALRGGACSSAADRCRPACRDHGGPDYHVDGIGVRLVWSWAPHS
jgi:formylglycine-generating enzyme required for sulfatase activity